MVEGEVVSDLLEHIRSENAGVSSDNAGEKPARRKTQGFLSKDNPGRVSRPLRCSQKGEADGKRINISVLFNRGADAGTEKARPAQLMDVGVKV